MNTETDYLKTIAEEIASAQKHKPQETSKANTYLCTEAKRLEREVMLHLNAIKERIQYDIFYLNVMNKLVVICDILFDNCGIKSPDVLVIIDLLTTLRALVPGEITVNVKLPRAFIALQQPYISGSWQRYRIMMDKYGVHGQLVSIAAIPFNKFTDLSSVLYWRDYTWLKGYQAKLDILDWEQTDCNSHSEALMSLLIGRDFNDDRFYVYCKKYIQDRTAKVSGKRKRLLEYAACEKLVLQDTQIGMASFDVRANSVSARLLKWIREEIDFVETHEKENPHLKLHLNMYVNRIAFFFKLLHEQKLFGDTSFKELSQQIASTCLSADGEEIQATTIISKAYPKDQKMLEEMEKLLVGMLEYVRSFMRK
ncbi:unnamed protein product [Sphagnum tenellum]